MKSASRKRKRDMQAQEPKPELSQKEKERRWSLLRQTLKKAGLTALIVYGGTQLGVPVHYLARVWGSKMNALIFPVDGEPILFIPSNTAYNRAVTGQTGLLGASRKYLLLGSSGS